MSDEKKVAEFLQDIGIKSQEGDVVSPAADQPWNEGQPVLIVKPSRGIVVWIWPEAKFWDFWDRVRELGQILESWPKKGDEEK